MLAGIGREGARDGSEPSGAGPMAGPDVDGEGFACGGGILRSSSMRSPLSVPSKLLLPILNETPLPSILPDSIGVAPSAAPKKLPLADSIAPVSWLPS